MAMHWSLTAAGACNPELEPEFVETLRELLVFYGATESQLSSDNVNGPVHEAVAKKTKKTSE